MGNVRVTMSDEWEREIKEAVAPQLASSGRADGANPAVHDTPTRASASPVVAA